MSRTGGCYCGAIRFELSVPIEIVVNCHCRSCRRVGGGVFSTVAAVETSEFTVTCGESELREFDSDPGIRYFCGVCGGRLFSRGASDDRLTNLLISTLDEELTTSPLVHLNVESKAPWYDILDDRPQFPDLPDLAPVK